MVRKTGKKVPVITRDRNGIILIWENLHILVSETVMLTKHSIFHLSL